MTLDLIRRLNRRHWGITRPTDSYQTRKKASIQRPLCVCVCVCVCECVWNICTCVVVLTCQRSPARACTMCYLLAYSCYCYFLESFYKELTVALLRVVRHGPWGRLWWWGAMPELRKCHRWEDTHRSGYYAWWIEFRGNGNWQVSGGKVEVSMRRNCVGRDRAQ